MKLIFKVLVDADACPRECLAVIEKYAEEYGYRVITVANFEHRFTGASHLMVGNEPQAADMAIINLVQAGDIVVTQDWGLAAMVLGKKGLAISTRGRIFKEQQIDFLLEERNVKAKLRRSGVHGKGPSKLGPVEKRLFEDNFSRLLSHQEKKSAFSKRE